MNLTIVIAASMVISKQQLIAEDGRHKLGLVVGQTSMPDPLVQPKGPLEPFVEGFNASPAAHVEGRDATGLLDLSAWRERLPPGTDWAEVYRAYRSGAGTLTAGAKVATIRYDGLGRRTSKAITNSGDWDCIAYHYYYDGQQMIEMRREPDEGAQEVLKQYVWGTQYVDELVQIGFNQDPQNADLNHDGDSEDAHEENKCERFFYILQDANYNVLGVCSAATSSGDYANLVERYEYTPYGRRTIYSRGWYVIDCNDDGIVDSQDASIIKSQFGIGPPDSRADVNSDGIVDSQDYSWVNNYFGSSIASDELVTHPTLESSRGKAVSGLAPTIHGICDIGHQGLMHDREFGLIYNRARYLHPVLGRFMQRDPIGYVDGMSLYEYVGSGPASRVDPRGGWWNKVLLREERVRWHGEWGVREIYVETWGHWCDSEWTAVGDSRSKQTVVFRTYPQIVQDLKAQLKATQSLGILGRMLRECQGLRIRLQRAKAELREVEEEVATYKVLQETTPYAYKVAEDLAEVLHEAGGVLERVHEDVLMPARDIAVDTGVVIEESAVGADAIVRNSLAMLIQADSWMALQAAQYPAGMPDQLPNPLWPSWPIGPPIIPARKIKLWCKLFEDPLRDLHERSIEERQIQAERLDSTVDRIKKRLKDNYEDRIKQRN